MCLQLLSLSPAGAQAVTGPKQVTVEQGSSLAVSCSYKPRYKLNSKYWCRKNSLWPCLTYIIETDGSEVTVTQDRVSIRDNHTANSFTVTLNSVTPGDAGQYSCGVKKRVGINRWHSTKVMVSAAVSNTTEDSNLSPLTTNPLCLRD
uniref:Ig-like domain-containing protein n=1 Tax=Serinus canaria TaxID=9135 RepID=A0A8C9KUR4_SERCA